MHLSPREQEKLLVVVAADLAAPLPPGEGVEAQATPEAIAIITFEIFEGARDGKAVVRS